ncbi:MAG: hypothetical protein JWN96_537 [Mycobacterium sp.]|jgi:hypothetical protein|nr:hypothetical protein [Mycobacterium sp.]
MSDRNSARLGACGGAAFVVLSLVGGGGGGGGPANDASRAEVGRYFASASATNSFTAAGPLLEILAMLALLVFWSYVSTVLRQAEGNTGWLSRVVYSAGVGSVVLKLGSFPAAYALHVRSGKGVDPALLTALFDMNNAAFVLGWATSGLALIALAASAHHTRALPPWIRHSAAFVGAGLLVAIPFANGAGIIAFLALLIWLLATSIAMVIRPAVALTPDSNGSTTTGRPVFS